MGDMECTDKLCYFFAVDKAPKNLVEPNILYKKLNIGFLSIFQIVTDIA